MGRNNGDSQGEREKIGNGSELGEATRGKREKRHYLSPTRGGRMFNHGGMGKGASYKEERIIRDTDKLSPGWRVV